MPGSPKTTAVVPTRTRGTAATKPATALTPATTRFSNYAALLKAIRLVISEGQAIIERQQTMTYWQVGRYICDYVLAGEKRAEYGGQVITKLSKDLGISADTLERSVRFAREFPISATSRKLRWSHFSSILAVKDPAKRLEFLNKAESQNLQIRQLRREIARFNLSEKAKSRPKPSAPVTLPVQRGRLYTYQIITPVAAGLKGDRYVDCGFNVWKQAGDLIPTPSRVGKQAGELIPTPLWGGSGRGANLITTIKKGLGYALQPARADTQAAQLFTYKAYLEKIIDGDTIWLNIDVGFDNVIRQKVRFNAIDTPEITTLDGRKARRLVEKALNPLEFFVIKTYKSDKYDRYLTDIFYLPGAVDLQDVATQGRYLNQELLDAGLAQRWQEE